MRFTNSFVLIIIILLMASSCTDRKEVSLTFVLDHPVASNKYPEYIKDIATPFNSTELNKDILLKPINLTRLDISNKIVETNAWYFKDMGDNTVEFSKGWLEQYFKDSSITPYAIEPAVRTASLDAWLAKISDSVFIYSESAETNEFKGKQVFTDAKQLNAKIQQTIIANPECKISIILNPKDLEIQAPPIAGTTEPAKETITSVTETQTTTNTASTISASSLEEYFQKLADPGIPYNNKTDLRNGVIKYFTGPNALVINVNNNGEALTKPTSIEDYIEHICSTHRHVYIKQKNMEGNNISVLKVQEQ